MDGLFHGKSYEQVDDLGGFPAILGNTHIFLGPSFLKSLGTPGNLEATKGQPEPREGLANTILVSDHAWEHKGNIRKG